MAQARHVHQGGDKLFVEYLKNAYSHWSTHRKVEPPDPIEKELLKEKQEEEAVIVEIVFDDEEEEQKLPEENHDKPERKHTLSIWV